MKSRLVSWGSPAAMLGGALYVALFGVSALIYGVFAAWGKVTPG